MDAFTHVSSSILKVITSYIDDKGELSSTTSKDRGVWISHPLYTGKFNAGPGCSITGFRGICDSVLVGVEVGGQEEKLGGLRVTSVGDKIHHFTVNKCDKEFTE